MIATKCKNSCSERTRKIECTPQFQVNTVYLACIPLISHYTSFYRYLWCIQCVFYSTYSAVHCLILLTVQLPLYLKYSRDYTQHSNRLCSHIIRNLNTLKYSLIVVITNPSFVVIKLLYSLGTIR